MSKSGVIRLIKSLSASEKRHFKLHYENTTGVKNYLDLFDIIDQTKLAEIYDIEEKFNRLHPKSSLENAAKYLLKVLTDCLIRLKSEKDNAFQQYHGLLRAKIMFERNLMDEGYKELKKVQEQSRISQNYLIQYLTFREELNYLSDLNFCDQTEQDIMEMQTESKNILKNLHQIHDHHSLFELLKYRFVHSGKSLSEQDKKRLNDLLLTELSLITGKISSNFELQKFHLLFQSFFFTNIGDYKSALKTFNELNKLFESNIEKLGNPPADYLSSLEGILDSLRTIRCYNEMDFYISKMQQLIKPDHTEYFNFIVEKTILTFRLNILTGIGQFKESVNFISAIDPNLLKEANTMDYEKQCELMFYIGLAYFGVNEWDKSNKYINKIILLGKSNFRSPIYKAARLLSILIHYELNNLEYLQYEIRSYKRSFQYKNKLLRIEKLIFTVVTSHPNGNNPPKNTLLWKKNEAKIKLIEADKFEIQILKYFDFIAWIEAKLKRTNLPLLLNKYKNDHR